ncbi:MAG: ATP-binding protein [Janthinobacterium lividum]
MGERSLHPGLETTGADRSESHLRLLIDTGLLLASERSLDVIVQAALDAGLELSGASFGAFFSDMLNGTTEHPELYKVSGADASRFSAFPTSWPTANFASTSAGQAILRSDDITTDPRHGLNTPFAGMSSSHVPVRSYLSVPVRSRAGEVLGALVYGHPYPGVFRPEAESLVATIAAQAAMAIENTRLTEHLNREIALSDVVRADQRSTGRRLSQALEAAQLGTWSWNARTGLISFDERAAALFGVTPHVPVLRDSLRDRIVHQEDKKLAAADLREVLRAGGQYTAEYRVQPRPGVQHWVHASGIADFASIEAGQVTGMIGTLQEISARKAQEETLRTSEKLAATGRLAATIAHEINNPLEAVTNLIYLAKTDPETPSSVSRLLETADTELMRVAQIAQQTLGFYRDTTRPVSVDLNDLVQAVVDLFNRKLVGKRLHCTLDLEPSLSIVGLQGEIRQVVSNLLVNAIDASFSTGGRIHIRARRRQRNGGHGVSLLISDQGSGIPKHVRSRLFTPFMTTKQSLGTGLGLWVTQGMVEKHGGSVRFRSCTDTPSGTVFRVYLPESGAPGLFASQTAGVLQ